MVIMSKFEKRLKKISKGVENAIVVGNAFGHLEELLLIYKTVFIVASSRPEIKSKNLVYREDFKDLSHLPEISMVFFDLDQVHHLNAVATVMTRYRPTIVIEGNDAIGRDLSKPLYDNNYRCTNLLGLYHIWNSQT